MLTVLWRWRGGVISMLVIVPFGCSCWHRTLNTITRTGS
jgi:hypothetical protein